MYTIKFNNVNFTYILKKSDLDKRGVFAGEFICVGQVLATLNPHHYPQILNYINHSCDPNSALSENFSILATVKNIEVGEEITIDYRKLDPKKFLKFGFVCNCGSCSNQVITNRDLG